MAGIDGTVFLGFMIAAVVWTAVARIAEFIWIDRLGVSMNRPGASLRPLFATAIALGWLVEPLGALTKI